MPRRLSVLIVLVAAATCTPAAAADPLTGRLLVTYEDGATAAARAAAASTADVRRAGAPIPELDVAVLAPRRGASLAAAARRLRADPRVVDVDAERRFSLRYVPNDPALIRQEGQGAPAGTTVQWWAARSNLPAAWDLTRGVGAVVAVIDTGVDGTHPDLADRVLPGGDFDEDPGRDDPMVDEVGHGTHVASMACAAADNGIGIAGAGFGCTILPVKTDLSEASVARSIVYATQQGAHAINMSFGTSGERPAATAVVQALEQAHAAGVVLVAAAADEPTEEQGDPANVLQPTGTGADLAAGIGLSVTAAQSDDRRASFAGHGSQISLAAYGALGTSGPPGLLGAFPDYETDLERGSLLGGQAPCRCRTTFDGDARYAYLQGTSMAAPMVAAVGALIRRFNPDVPLPDVLRIVKETARGDAWNPDTGWGVLDAGAALAAAAQQDRTAPSSRVRRVTRSGTVRATTFTLRWSGSDRGPAGVRRSGVARYELWRSVNGAAARRLRTTTQTSLRVHGARGSRYRFYTVAVDADGNREAVPARADASVRIVSRAGAPGRA